MHWTRFNPGTHGADIEKWKHKKPYGDDKNKHQNKHGCQGVGCGFDLHEYSISYISLSAAIILVFLSLLENS